MHFFEEGDTQDLQNCVEIHLQVEAFSDDGNKDVGRNGDPDLGFYCIVGCSVEGLYVKMLLDPFEEQFDLPSALVEFGDCQCGKDEIVGEKNEQLLSLGVEVL